MLRMVKFGDGFAFRVIVIALCCLWGFPLSIDRDPYMGDCAVAAI